MFFNGAFKYTRTLMFIDAKWRNETNPNDYTGVLILTLYLNQLWCKLCIIFRQAITYMYISNTLLVSTLDVKSEQSHTYCAWIYRLRPTFYTIYGFWNGFTIFDIYISNISHIRATVYKRHDRINLCLIIRAIRIFWFLLHISEVFLGDESCIF